MSLHVTSIKLQQLLSSDISPGGSAGTPGHVGGPLKTPGA